MRPPREGFSVKEILEAVKGKLISGNTGDRACSVSIDSRTLKKGDIFICIKGNRFDGHDFIREAIHKGARCVIADEKKSIALGDRLPSNLISAKNTLLALAGLAILNRKRFDIPLLAVTGSNGKTTTKEMLSALLGSRYKVLKNEGTQNNIIGLSLSLLRLNHSHEIAALELGTNHFGEIKELSRIALPTAAILTNIGSAHLEFFGDESGVLKEKWSLVESLSSPRIAIVNADDSFLRDKISTDTGGVIFSFGIKRRADFMAKEIICKDGRVFFRVNGKRVRLNTSASINAYNALAAYSAARIFGISDDGIMKKFREFRFPDGRFQIKNLKGLRVIDDAYNANPGSFLCALEALSSLPCRGRKIVVMADMLELGERSEFLHRMIGEQLCRMKIDAFIGVGKLSHSACDAAKRSGFNGKIILKCSSAQDARDVISGFARKGDTILLKGSRAMKLEEVLKDL
ncbi:UDP-N-acetylmuramoyl-tripeptide--D-alanyl-D-alanine ligase [bacterium]|nr:MAG: UDP-N-acetylmuramoyl-tripeptide--D-alanyl-D-alanine ligase [bacterium]